MKFMYAMRTVRMDLTAGNVLCFLLGLPSPAQKYEGNSKCSVTKQFEYLNCRGVLRHAVTSAMGRGNWRTLI